MIESVLKVLVTSVLVVAIAEAAKRSSLLGAILASIPVTSVLAMIWLYLDTGDTVRIADLAHGIFWLVLPSLVLFIALPLLLRGGVPFVPSLIASIALTAVAYFGLISLLARFAIRI